MQLMAQTGYVVAFTLFSGSDAYYWFLSVVLFVGSALVFFSYL